MSSHHIIRENQEPALLIMDAKSAPVSVQELLEWSPLVVVAESALTEVLSWGIKIDVVIAQEYSNDSLKNTLHDQFPVKLISYAHEHEAVTTGLNFLIAAKHKAVTILSEKPLETFESFSALDLAVIQSGKRWVFIKTGRFEKWLPVGSTLYVYPDTANPAVTTREDGIAAISHDRAFWVAELVE